MFKVLKSCLKLILFLIIVNLLTGISLAEQDIFDFDPEKIDQGNLYVYQMSANPEQFELRSRYYYYYKSVTENYLAVECIINSRKRGIYTTYRLNWNYMMLEKSTWEVFDPTLLTDHTTKTSETRTDFINQVVAVEFTNKVEEGFKDFYFVTTYEITPTFNYASMHLDFWTIMRFYPFSERKITVGMIEGQKYVEKDIIYQGIETVEVPYGSVKAHKFELKGRGLLARLFGKRGWLWLTAEDERNYMVKYRNENKRGNLPIVDMRLEKIEAMSSDEWKGFKGQQ